MDPNGTQRTFTFVNLGRMAYARTLRIQEALFEARKENTIGDVILFVEHDPVITAGRGAKLVHVLLTPERQHELGVDFVEVGRGGDVTYHGPGQQVVYPILDLAPDRMDVRRYVQDLEGVMIDVCAHFGLNATRIPGLNGAWITHNNKDTDTFSVERKIGAVGVRLSRWVTMHGIALNHSTNLDHFKWIVPCGINNKPVTSLQHEGIEASMEEVRTQMQKSLLERFAATLNLEPSPMIASIMNNPMGSPINPDEPTSASQAGNPENDAQQT